MRRDAQLRLQLDLPTPRDYGSWVRHANVEQACNRLALWQVHGGRLWLTSTHSAGKSHLLQSLVEEHTSIGKIDLDARQLSDADNSWQLAQQWTELLNGTRKWVFDLAPGAIPHVAAHALFHMLERNRSIGGDIMISWRGDANLLPGELSSRLYALEKVEMAQPDHDEALLQILRNGASNMQWEIREQVLTAMLTYLPRRLDILMPALHELEARSFAQKQKPGAAWVKQQLLQIAEQRTAHA